MNEAACTETKKGKVRRVGCVTMGLSLIAAGSMMIYGMFQKNIDFAFLAKLSPLILISLGGEILAAYFSKKEYDFKYDVVSGIICFLLVMFSLTVAGIFTMFDMYLETML